MLRLLIGGVDLKFKNNNSFPIKIYASANDTEVTVRIVRANV